MLLLSATQIGLISAGILSTVLTVVLALKLPTRAFHWSLPAATAIQGLWGFGLAIAATYSLAFESIVILEVLRTSAWIIALTRTLDVTAPRGAAREWHTSLRFIAACHLFLGVFHLCGWLGLQPLAWQFLLLTAVGLIAISELQRQVRHSRFIGLLCLNASVMFAFDLFYFADELFDTEQGQGNLQLRSGVVMACSLFLGLAAITFDRPSPYPAHVSLSRPAVFYVVSLTLMGFLVSVLILGSYYAQRFKGHWGLFIYMGLLLGALLALLYVLVFKRARENLRVMINKHLFSHKYDYRAEWLRLISQLSQPMAAENVHRHALKVLGSIFRSRGGALWLARGQVFAPVHREGLDFDLVDAIEAADTPFIEAMRTHEWVFLLRDEDADPSLARYNELLPAWVRPLRDVWLVTPLLSEDHLVGFAALTKPESDTSLNWEDLDLLKTVGRQIANYLRRHEQSEQLAEVRQFDAFNKLSAYVMHDLKNLIAQQTLVVKNAERHKDNPAFVEDAINTIHNSVNRMNTLLRKLQRNEPETTRVLSLQAVLVEAVKRCQKAKPQPSLRSEVESARVKGDFESLVMVFVHIIQNAQDATPATGFVDVSVSGDDSRICVSIEDNGAGMDEKFIQERLFRPFETTKTGKGMGIGVYQARDYVQHLGGHISVESTLGEGTTFFITLPALAESATTPATAPAL